MSLNCDLAPLLGNDQSDDQLGLSTVRGVDSMPPEQLALAPGELVALEARSHDDLPDDAD